MGKIFFYSDDGRQVVEVDETSDHEESGDESGSDESGSDDDQDPDDHPAGDELGAETAAALPALPAAHIGRLPELALRRVLLGSTDNLLRHAAACAGVCREWRRIVGTSAAYSYGRDRAGWIERRRVLRGVAQALDRELSGQHDDHHLNLNGLRLGDAGAGALAAALTVRVCTTRPSFNAEL